MEIKTPKASSGKKVISCMSTDIKDILRDALSAVGLEDDSVEIQELLDMPECDDDATIGFIAVGKAGKKQKAKRAPSAYNEFIGSCIKSRPSGSPVADAMKGCAAQWKQKKSA